MRLFFNHLRRTWIVATIAAIGIFGVHALVPRVFVSIIARRPRQFTQDFPKALQDFFDVQPQMLGTLTGLLVIAYQHPFLIAAMLVVIIALASGLLTAEVERKTLPLLLARPISRIGIVWSCSVTCVLWAAVLAASAVAGTYAGGMWAHVAVPDLTTMLRVAANLFALEVAVAGVAVGFSAWSSERGDAVGWSVVIVLAMYVWNTFAQLWPAAKPYEEYTLFHYYAPARLFMGGAPLLWDYQLLATVGLVGFLAATLIYAIRDFHV